MATSFLSTFHLEQISKCIQMEFLGVSTVDILYAIGAIFIVFSIYNTFAIALLSLFKLLMDEPSRDVWQM